MNSVQLSMTQCQWLVHVSCIHDFRYRNVFHKMSIEHDYCENQCSDRHITYGCTCNCACIFYIFLSIWIKFRRGSGHINSLNDHEFCEKWCNESHKLLKVYFPHPFFIWVKFVMRYLNIILMNIWEFFGNWHREGHMFLMSMNELTFTRVLTSVCVSPLQPPSAPHSLLGWGLAAFCKYCNILFTWVKFI
jgi:hypothetical protein